MRGVGPRHAACGDVGSTPDAWCRVVVRLPGLQRRHGAGSRRAARHRAGHAADHPRRPDHRRGRRRRPPPASAQDHLSLDRVRPVLCRLHPGRRSASGAGRPVDRAGGQHLHPRRLCRHVAGLRRAAAQQARRRLRTARAHRRGHRLRRRSRCRAGLPRSAGRRLPGLVGVQRAARRLSGDRRGSRLRRRAALLDLRQPGRLLLAAGRDHDRDPGRGRRLCLHRDAGPHGRVTAARPAVRDRVRLLRCRRAASVDDGPVGHPAASGPVLVTRPPRGAGAGHAGAVRRARHQPQPWGRLGLRRDVGAGLGLVAGTRGGRRRGAHGVPAGPALPGHARRSHRTGQPVSHGRAGRSLHPAFRTRRRPCGPALPGPRHVQDDQRHLGTPDR